MERRLNQIQNDNQKLQNDNQKLQNANQMLQTELQKERNVNQSLRANISQFNRDLTAYKTEVERLCTENVRLSQKASHCQRCSMSVNT